MAQNDNIISFGNTALASGQNHLSPTAKGSVDKCRQVVMRLLPPLMTGLFEKLDDSLYELADKSDSNALQTTYFDAMREMRKERARVEKLFNEQVIKNFDLFWTEGPVEFQPDNSGGSFELSDEMSLLDEEELEESLAISNLVSKGENRYHRELFALNERFSYLANGVEVNDQNNPVSPAAICHQFKDLMQPIALELPVKLVIYKLFDKHVMHYVGGLYDELNLELGKDGIMTKLTPKVRRNPVAPVLQKGGQVDAAEQPIGGPTMVDKSEIQSEVFNTLQQLLVQRNTGGTLAPGAPIAGMPLPAVETPDLVSALSGLQQSNVTLVPFNAPGVSAKPNLRQTLIGSLKMESDGELNKTLGQADNDTIDVISMLFEYILEDRNLPDAMKALIGRLQIPMLKVAIVDKSFFSKKLHPARKLLNNMAKAAVGWCDNGDRSKGSLYGTVESIVKRILTEFVEDTSIFDELNETFSAFLEREDRGAEVAEERTNQVMRGKEQLTAAKILVSREINSRLGQRDQVPEVVHSLLTEGWKDVLLLIHLRRGIESEEWRKGLDLIDKLLWSVEPKEEYKERQELLKDIPDLLRSLREGLAEISYDQHKMARLFKELQNCHIICLKGRQDQAQMVSTKCFKAEAAAARTRSVTEDIVLDSTPSSVFSQMLEDDAVQEVKRDEFDDIADALKVGGWIEIKEEEEGEVRVKLSWKSDVTNTYVFVNRKGVKVREITVQELANLFRNKQASKLEKTNVPIMDRALDAMMNALKKTEASAAAV